MNGLQQLTTANCVLENRFSAVTKLFDRVLQLVIRLILSAYPCMCTLDKLLPRVSKGLL